MPRKPSTPDPERQLMIKTKACQRLIKEAAHYRKELIENEEKLNQMKKDQKDHYDIKMFAQVVDESRVMVPDSQARLEQALEDLAAFVSQLGEEPAPAELVVDKNGEWFVTATALLKEHGGEKAGTDEVLVETRTDHLAEGEAF